MSAPDEYERRYMRANEALARERVSMAWWGHAIFLFALANAIHSAVAHKHFLALVLVPLVWLLCITLRVVVTRSDVHVQLGVFGPRIPVADIEVAEAVRGSMVRAGWGIRFGFDGSVTYSVPAVARDYLRVVYRRKGRTRVVRVMSSDPARLVRAIEAARRELSNVRIGVDSAPRTSSALESSLIDGDERDETAPSKTGRAPS